MTRILGERNTMDSCKDPVFLQASIILVIVAMAFPVINVHHRYAHVIRGKRK